MIRELIGETKATVRDTAIFRIPIELSSRTLDLHIACSNFVDGIWRVKPKAMFIDKTNRLEVVFGSRYPTEK